MKSPGLTAIIERSLLSALGCLVFSGFPAISADKSGIELNFITDKSKESQVKCVNPNAECMEAKRVIETLHEMARAYTSGDFEKYSSFLADGVTTIDDSCSSLVIGKEAVLKLELTKRSLSVSCGTQDKITKGKEAVVVNARKKWEAAQNKEAPLVSYTIYHPYAKVTGDRAVVSFKAIKEIGGPKPETLVSNCTDIFVKQDGQWKKMHYRSSWKTASAADSQLLKQ